MVMMNLYEVLKQNMGNKASVGEKQRCEQCGSTMDVKRVVVTGFCGPSVKCLCLKCRMAEQIKTY